jgi:hypothetical protein
MTCFYPLIVDAEGDCCTRSQSVTHTLGTSTLDERSARLRELCLKTHNNHKRQTTMMFVGFEPVIPANERPQTHALDCAANGIGNNSTYYI